MKFASITSGLLMTCTLLCAQRPIDTTEVLSIGGIQQYISVKGKDTSLPLLLFLHGGPGGSVMHYADKFTHRLQNHFVVIQWDQRQTGKTLALNPSPLPLTLEQFQRDTYEMIMALLAKFGREGFISSAIHGERPWAFTSPKIIPHCFSPIFPSDRWSTNWKASESR